MVNHDHHRWTYLGLGLSSRLTVRSWGWNPALLELLSDLEDTEATPSFFSFGITTTIIHKPIAPYTKCQSMFLVARVEILVCLRCDA